MINFDDATRGNIKQHNPNCPQTPDHPQIILITVGALDQKNKSDIPPSDIDKIYRSAKYQLLFNKRLRVGLKAFDDTKSFIVTRMVWMIFVKKVINTIPIKEAKY